MSEPAVGAATARSRARVADPAPRASPAATASNSTGGSGGANTTQGAGPDGGPGGNGSQGSGTNSGGGGGGGGYIGGSGGTGTTGGAALCAGGGGGGGGSSWVADGLTGASFTQPGGGASVTVVFTVDPVPTPDITPFETTEDLVVQQFEDLLGRAPTTEELETAIEEIDTFDRVAEDVILDLLSDDQHAVDAQVIRLYLAYFGRPPETAGLEYWVAAIEGGKSVHTASNQFAAMNEFRSLYGPRTNRAFVELVYQNVLGRAGEPAGLDYWTGELDAGRFKRGTVMTQFSEAPENRTAKTVHVGVVRIYLAMLGSTPRKAYLNAAVAPFRAGDATVPAHPGVGRRRHPPQHGLRHPRRLTRGDGELRPRACRAPYDRRHASVAQMDRASDF